MIGLPSGEGAAVGRRSQLESVKTYALARGIRITDAALSQLGGPSALTIHEYSTTGGVTLVLPLDVYVNAPFDEWFSAASELVLDVADQGYRLKFRTIAIDVDRVLPLPGYLDSVDSKGRAVRDTTMSHGDRIRVSPIVGCSFDCAFCDLRGLRYRRRPIEQLLEGIDVARADSVLPPRHLLISGGTPSDRELDEGYFREVCEAIVDHCRRPSSDGPPLDVDIMMSPRRDTPSFVEHMVARGVFGFAFNVELWSEEASRRYARLKSARSRPYLRDAIDAAVCLLGRGTGRVRSLIVLGLEPPDEAIRGIEWLAMHGCDPTLSPFRPAAGTPLASVNPPQPDDLRGILDAARALATRESVHLGPSCVACQHNTLTFPWDVEPCVATGEVDG